MTTFTLESARQLHQQLPAFNILKPVADDVLTRSYLGHYGLADIPARFTSVRHSLGSFPSLHFQLAGHCFSVPAAQHTGTMVIVHGYYDHVGLYRHPIEYCLARGLSVLTFDLPGHGLSGGGPASITSFDHYSKALVDCIAVAQEQGLPGPLSIMAQSTGAATVINCLLKGGQFPLPELDKIVFLAPLLRPANWANNLRKFRLLSWFVKKVNRTFAINSHDENFLRFIADEDPLQARVLMVDWVRALRQYLHDFELAATRSDTVHIIQGTEDTTVDWQYNLPKLKEKFPGAVLYELDGARHHLVNESDAYRDQLFTLIDGILDLEAGDS